MQLEDAAAESGLVDIQRRADVAEEHSRQLEDRCAMLQSEVDRLKEAEETLSDALATAERGRREDARAREDANESFLRMRQQVERLTDELQRYAIEHGG